MSDGVPAGRARSWWIALRLVVVTLWLILVATAWWAAPRKQSYEQARADVAAGHVAAYQWGDRWDVDVRWFSFRTPVVESSDTLGPLFAWRTADGRVWWTDTRVFDQVEVAGGLDEAGYAGPGAVGIAQHIRAVGLEDRYGEVHPLQSVLTGLGLCLTVVFLGVVVAGPAPVLGTRWYWFWLVGGVPFGLGLLFWLAREHPWSGSAAASAPASPGQRDRGILGFALAILAAFLISLVVLALHQFLGDRWIPRPDA